MNRRQLLTTAGAATLAGGLGAGPSAFAAPGTTADLNKLFDAFVSEGLDLQPEETTSLGLDVGARAGQKFKLSDRGPVGVKAQQNLGFDQLRRLEAFDASALPPSDSLNRDVVLYGLRQQADAARRFKYAGGGAGAPYFLNQFQGSAYHDLP